MHRFANILIPTDFSPAAWSAIKYGLRIAKREPTRLTLLHVYPTSHKKEILAGTADQKELRNISEFEEEMHNLCDHLQPQHKNIKLDCAVKTGDVNQEVLQYLKEQQCDLIIIGVNSNGQDNKAGKHAAAILEAAQVPVMMIPNKQIKE